MTCGCHSTVNAQETVEFCPLHAAAPKLRDALERAAKTLQDVHILLKVKAAVGKVEPEWPVAVMLAAADARTAIRSLFYQISGGTP